MGVELAAPRIDPPVSGESPYALCSPEHSRANPADRSSFGQAVRKALAPYLRFPHGLGTTATTPAEVLVAPGTEAGARRPITLQLGLAIGRQSVPIGYC